VQQRIAERGHPEDPKATEQVAGSGHDWRRLAGWQWDPTECAESSESAAAAVRCTAAAATTAAAAAAAVGTTAAAVTVSRRAQIVYWGNNRLRQPTDQTAKLSVSLRHLQSQEADQRSWSIRCSLLGCRWGLPVEAAGGGCLWRQPVGDACGGSRWGLPVGAACGFCLWGLPVDSACEGRLWGPPVGAACGGCLWRLPVGAAGESSRCSCFGCWGSLAQIVIDTRPRTSTKGMPRPVHRMPTWTRVPPCCTLPVAGIDIRS